MGNGRVLFYKAQQEYARVVHPYGNEGVQLLDVGKKWK